MPDEEPEKIVFASTDKRQSGGQLDERDREIMESARTGKGLINLTTEQALELGKRALGAWEELSKLASPMTKAQASDVFTWRCLEGGTWRTIATKFSEKYGIGPAHHQIWGMALCEKAETMFPKGEWN